MPSEFALEFARTPIGFAPIYFFASLGLTTDKLAYLLLPLTRARARANNESNRLAIQLFDCLPLRNERTDEQTNERTDERTDLNARQFLHLEMESYLKLGEFGFE